MTCENALNVSELEIKLTEDMESIGSLIGWIDKKLLNLLIYLGIKFNFF